MCRVWGVMISIQIIVVDTLNYHRWAQMSQTVAFVAALQQPCYGNLVKVWAGTTRGYLQTEGRGERERERESQHKDGKKFEGSGLGEQRGLFISPGVSGLTHTFTPSNLQCSFNPSVCVQVELYFTHSQMELQTHNGSDLVGLHDSR